MGIAGLGRGRPSSPTFLVWINADILRFSFSAKPFTLLGISYQDYTIHPCHFIDFSVAIIIIIIINEEIIVAFSPRTTRTRYKVKKKQNREIRRV